MEDYKKRYKEALSQAKKELKCCGSLDCDAARQIFRFFPELKESEDERRIRKDLIGYFEVCGNRTFAHHRVSDIIAWLKKQGEKTTKWSEEDEYVFSKVLDWMLIVNPTSSIFEKLPKEQFIERFKSIKERYTWKPSDEQIKALNYVVNLMASSESPTENDYYYNVFKDMRTQLKKLKE